MDNKEPQNENQSAGLPDRAEATAGLPDRAKATAGERLTESLENKGTSAAPATAPQGPPRAGGGINKYFIIAGVLVLLIVGGVVWSTFFSEREEVVETGVTRDITITTHENTWNFDPEEIEVNRGDRVRLTVINEDEYDHGFAIDAYGISQRMPAKGTIHVEFVATRGGVFPYYCSVSCGSGIVDGEERGHFDQIGTLHVRSLISETTDYEPELSDDELRAQARQAATRRAADEKAQELGFDTTKLTYVFDGGSAAWNAHRAERAENEHDETLDALEDIEYFTAYYANAAGESVLWIFIDSDTGDIIAHEE